MTASAGPTDAWQARLRERVGERRGDRALPAVDGRDLDALLSVVVLNWNGARVIARCLDHLAAQTHPRLQVVVVDNGSTDGSRELLRARAARGEIELVESARNLGVGGGRNLGAARARGDVVAFLDNDAFPEPSWAQEIAAAFAAEPRLGAAASLVFFDGQKSILNSAGGTLNWRGHGADWCFNTPYELAVLPDAVLYPTGCGMAVRRDVLEAMGGADEAVSYYGYDDVEVGIRTWALGWRVGLVRSAWIDHEGRHSERLEPARALFCERGRIRNALKYLPARRLPAWLLHEAQALDQLRVPGARLLTFRAWAWNLRHIGSALRLRRSVTAVDFDPLLHPSWRRFPWLRPDNRAFRPEATGAASRVVLDGSTDAGALHFGWYEALRERGKSFRWTADVASVVLATEGARRLSLLWRAAPPDREVRLELRRLGETEPTWVGSARVSASWDTSGVACEIPAGGYELLLRAAVAVQRIALE